jgi:hypothetical protein
VARRPAWLGALLLAATLTGGTPWEAPYGARAAGAPVELRRTLGPLQKHFNAHHDLPRAVLLLSPT